MDIKQAAHSTPAAQPELSTGAESAPLLRRGLMAAGLSGVAISLLPWLGTRAGAQARTVPPTGGDASTTTAAATTTTTPAPTTTAPPLRPTAADIALIGFAQSVELSIRDLYNVALQASVFDETTTPTIATIRDAHAAYANSLSGLIGRNAPGVRLDKLFDASKSDFTGDAATVARNAAELENVAIGTHVDIIGQLIGVNAAALLASVLVIEARHATVLHTIAGDTSIDAQLAGDATALSPSDYPVK